MLKDDRQQDKARWEDIVTKPSVKALYDYRDSRIHILQSENRELATDPSPTNLNKILQNMARITEINALIARADFYRNGLNNGRK